MVTTPRFGPYPDKVSVRWRVRLNRGRKPVHVNAEYNVIEAGCLKFRATNRGGYPTCVMAFAPGEWVSVENLGSPQPEGTV